MNLFLTGATGWVGSVVARQLLEAGHQVIGLARSDAGVASLKAMGAGVLHATLSDLEALVRAAADADAVVHTGFNHDFSRWAENCEEDRRAIEALGSALQGSSRPLIVTSGLSGLPKGCSELDPPNPASPRKSEAATGACRDRGVRASTVRLAPSVHGVGDHGFVPILVRLARETGVSAYLEEGEDCWSGVHREDAARVYVLALEQGATAPVYHAVADESVPFRAIAEVIGRQLGVPVESRGREHFGWFAMMAGGNMSASSTRTRQMLGWSPGGPGLLESIEQPAYYAS